MLLQQNIQSITKATTTENAGLVRGVLEVDGKPFFPRAIEHRGEPFIKLAQLGFNCVQLYEPASTTLLAEAEQAGVWIICPPPTLPDVDLRARKTTDFLIREPCALWDMGRFLSSEYSNLAEQGLRICDRREGRLIIASADSGLREISHIDMLVEHRAVLEPALS